MKSSGTLRDVWSLVLAGGNGERLGPLVQRWLGRHKPKQYCTFIGSRSMLQHTLDRSDRIIPAEQRVTIIARDHAEEAHPHLLSRTPGQVVLQPANRDTGVRILSTNRRMLHLLSCPSEGASRALTAVAML
jgi:mannose-1-phosphate guanylyltransferase